MVELFARHDYALKNDGNPMGEFWASMGDDEYGLDEMPESIGLYGGQYIITFCPDSCEFR